MENATIGFEVYHQIKKRNPTIASGVSSQAVFCSLLVRGGTAAEKITTTCQQWRIGKTKARSHEQEQTQRDTFCCAGFTSQTEINETKCPKAVGLAGSVFVAVGRGMVLFLM